MGITSYPGNENFLVGPIKDLDPVYKEKAAKGEVLPIIFTWMLELLTSDTREPGDPLIDASKNRVVAVNVIGHVMTFLQDPDAVSDFYNKHNVDIDKHDMSEDTFEPMFKDVFGTMHTNDEWRKQRKAIGHMFFKQRLSVMVGVFKEHLNASCDKWLDEIAKNGGTTKIDISVEFQRIFAHAINHICFGEDLNDEKFEFMYYDKIKETFTPKKLSMGEAIPNAAM